MLHESSHVRVSTDDGIGTLWLSPPGGRIGAAVLRELLAAVEVVAITPGIEILVLRSGTPVGFGRGLVAESCDERLPTLGQRVTAAVADLPFPTVAFVEGPCIGPGLELTLACDDRLAVAGPDSWVGFGELPPGWGGRTRLRLMGRRIRGRITAREAVRVGVFDFACCERRGKIELRTWLDRLQFHLRKRPAGWRGWFGNAEVGLAEERRQFRATVREGVRPAEDVPVRLPTRVGLVGVSPSSRHLAAEWAMRGVNVVWVEGTTDGLFAEAHRRGRLTPLEAAQATKRIHLTDDADVLTGCDWVALFDPHADLAGMLERDLPPRAILCVPPAHHDRATLLATRPQRVLGLRLQGETATLSDADPDATAAVAGWLSALGVTTTAAALAPSPALV
jgi:enoyl-CoA hydratase/carnithine racemase